ncbi:divergent PAP2 family protein [soil metagenome]
MRGLWSNAALWIPLSAALLVQLFKFFWEWARKGVVDYHVLTRTGGMPSSHSAMMSSLATVIGYDYGLGSPLFAISAVVAVIVMYDARGVRQESGKQARVLNRIVREFFSGQPIREQELKELLGHTGIEVFVGAIVGIVYTLTLLMWLIPGAVPNA